MDLFEQFDVLFDKKSIDDPPHPYVLNRFLSSDADYASFAQELLLHTWNPAYTWEIWRGAVPKLPSAPRMRYAAPKKQKADALVERIKQVEALRREEVQLLIDLAGTKELAAYYGVEIEEDDEDDVGEG
jgi:hypothetical protein